MERLIAYLRLFDSNNIGLGEFFPRAAEFDAWSHGNLRVFWLNFWELLKLLEKGFFGTGLSINFLILLFHDDKGLNQACITSFPNGTNEAIFCLFMHDFFDIRVEFGGVKELQSIDWLLMWDEIVGDELWWEESSFGNLLEHAFDDVFEGLGDIFFVLKVSDFLLQ